MPTCAASCDGCAVGLTADLISRRPTEKVRCPLTHGVRARYTVVCVVSVCARWANRTQLQPGDLRLLVLYLTGAIQRLFEDSLSRLAGYGAAVTYYRFQLTGTVTVGVYSPYLIYLCSRNIYIYIYMYIYMCVCI